MKKILLLSACALILQSITAQTADKPVNHRKYARQVRKTERILLREIERMPGFGGLDKNEEATPDQYWVQQYLSTMNPVLGKPTPELLIPVLESLYAKRVSNRAQPGKSVTPWIERGPGNVGGRTRALVWDPWDATGKKVWAGSVGGGLWYNSDITSSSSKWTPVLSLWSNLSVSAIGFGPIGKDTIYIGTGEGYGSSSSLTRGYGIWKSTDGGKTFSILSNTTSFYYCTDIVVRKENGKSVVYASIVPNYYGGAWQGAGAGSFGIYRSTNGGQTWNNVSGNAANSGKFCYGDLEIGADNRLWAGSMKNPNGGADAGGGRVMYSDNGTTWTTIYTGRDKTGRVEIACAPSSANTIYAAFESGGKLDSILVSTNRGTSFAAKSEPADADLGIPSSDFTRGQAWYDLILAVDPNDSNTAILGGVDLFRTTNKGGSWTQISKWSNNANLNTLSCPFVHADQHAIAYKPGSSSSVVFGCDGGVYYTSSVSTASSSNTAIGSRNTGYNVTQFYWGDMAGTSGSNIMIAGAQDNGTQRFVNTGVNTTTEVTGGDGAYCFISQSNSARQVSSYVYNTYYYTNNSWSSVNTLFSRSSLGRFINPAEWDENGGGLFTYRSTGKAYRIKLGASPGALDSFTYKSTGSELGSALYAHTNRAGKTRLWVGTDAGAIYMSSDAWTTTPSFATKTGTINAGNISGFNTFRFGDTMAVVLSNYGVKNIYTSFDSGTTWTSRDGNLPDMPVWGIVMNPNKLGEAVIATDIGIYGTSNIFTASPTWTADTAGIGPVKVSTIRYRKSDRMLMAVTHGRGVFTNDAWSKNTPIALFGSSAQNVCTNTTVSFLDSTLNDPSTWAWSISPKNFVYLNGTDSTSQNPKVHFTAGGSYSVKITAGNALGSNSLNKINFITVTDTIIGQASLSLSRSSICAGDTMLLTTFVNPVLNGSITSYTWSRNITNLGTGTSTMIVNPVAGDSFMATLTSNKFCVSPVTFNSNRVKPAVNAIVNASAKISVSPGCAGKPLSVSVNGTNSGSTPSWNWYLDGTLQSGNSGTLNIALPTNGSKVWATVNVSGPCVRPANLIQSDTATLIINPKPVTPNVSRNFDTLFASNVGAGTYTWYRSSVVKGTGRTLKITQNGTFKCVYTESGCSSDSSSAIVFNSLDVQNLQNARILYPNPASNFVLVPFSESCNEASLLRIYSANGAEVNINKNAFSKADNGYNKMDISFLPSGVYLLVVEAGKFCKAGSTSHYRFVKTDKQ